MDIESEDGENSKKGFENIVVFQNDPIYQDHWDHARMIVCRYSVDDDFDMKDKRVIFKPIVIDMLDVVSIPIQDERGEQSRVDCWMEISKGRFPQTNEIDGAVKVGSPLTLAIFVKDPRKRTDVRIKDCYAYDDPKVAETNGPALLQLTDFDGCPTKPKLIDVWKRTHDTGDTGATVIAFTTVTAFKFPDRPDLQLTCNIELCRNKCASRCSSEMPEPVAVGVWSKASVDDGSQITQKSTEDGDTEKIDNPTGKEEDSSDSASEKSEGAEAKKDEDTSEEKPEAKSDEKTESGEEAGEEKKEEGGEEKKEEGGEDKEEKSEEKSEDKEEGKDEAKEDKSEEDTEDKEESTGRSADGDAEKKTDESSSEEKTDDAEKKNENSTEEKDEDASGEEKSEGEEKKEDGEEKKEEAKAEEKGDDSDETTNEKRQVDDDEDTHDENSISKEEDEDEEDDDEKEATTAAPTTTTTTEATTTTVKSAKQKSAKTKTARKGKSNESSTKSSSKPKAASQILSDNSISSADQVTNIALISKSKGKTAVKVAPIHLSTTTLRPLKELMDYSSKKASKAIKKASKKTKQALKATTEKPTTTTTTTQETTTTKRAKKYTRPSTKSFTQKSTKMMASSTTNLPRYRIYNRRARHPVNTHPEEFPHLHQPQESSPVQIFYNENPLRRSVNSPVRRFGSVNRTGVVSASRPVTPAANNFRRFRESDEHSADIRSFYSYSHFQPQRIRHRNVRSVDPVMLDPKTNSIVLGARVITGLEVV